MEQRITRAKKRIAASRIPFETPGAAERAERLAAVMTTVYLLCHRAGWRPCRDPLRIRVFPRPLS